MDSTTQNKRASTDNRRPVRPSYIPHLPSPSHPFNQKPSLLTFQSKKQSGEMFQKIHTMKRDPANDRAAARRASFEEQSIPKGAGILGDMWNKYTRGGK